MDRLTLLACYLLLVLVAVSPLQAQHHEWAKAILGGQSRVTALANSPDGGVILVGDFGTGPLDLDPGPATHNIPFTFGNQNGYIVKLDSNGHFLWGGGIAGGSSIFAVATDAAGNVYATGLYQGAGDFDIGPGVDMHGQPGSGGFIMKLASNGQYQWTKALHKGYISGLQVAANGNFYITGQFADSTDFDPGPGTYSLLTNSGTDGYFARYDANGNLNWVKQITGGAGELIVNFQVDSSGIYLTGFYLDSVDMDPDSISQALLIEPTEGTWADDQLIGHYTLSGSFLWARQLYSNSRLHIRAMELDHQHNLVMGGYYGDTVDFDPGPAVHSLYVNPAGYNSYILKWDSSGNFVWLRDVGPDNYAIPDIATDAADDIYVLTNFKDTADMDPGVGVFPFISDGLIFADLGLIKLDPNGDFMDAKQITGTLAELAYTVTSDAQDRIYIGGSFRETSDFDPSAAIDTITSGQYGSGFVTKWSPDSCAGFMLHIDTVAPVNCTTQLGWMQASASGGTQPYTFAWNTIPPTSNPTANPVAGIYTVSVTDSIGCAAHRTVIVNGPANFNGFDLEVNLIAHSIFRPGSFTALTLDALNNGCQTISGELQFVVDSQLIYQTASPVPDSIAGDTLFWTFPSMNYDSAHFIANISVFVPLGLVNGDSVHFAVSILPNLGDVEPMDNFRTDYVFPIRIPMDPNEKSVYPPGSCEEHYTVKTDPLTYSIRFQNTGTAEAFEVAILDTLDPNIDIASLALKGNSHPLYIEALPGNVLKFVFPDIHLPDSNTNEPASHGYVVYEVMPVNAVVDGTEVTNGSAIYFDFNPPVLTNRVMNTLVAVVPACPVATQENIADDQWQMYPNPATSSLHLKSANALGELKVRNILGQMVHHQSSIQESDLTLDISKWPKGLYFVHLNGTVKRLVLK